MAGKYDFVGWATRNDLQCSDGRIIRHNAFKDCDGKRVPLVWNHQHNDIANVIGYADLANDPEGVIAHCAFNDTQGGRDGKECVKHGDVVSLSIYANQLRQQGANVMHGIIREVSLVLAGANPGAYIEDVLTHGDEDGMFSAEIYADQPIELYHADDSEGEEEEKPMADEAKKEKTICEIVDTMNEEQKQALYALVGMAADSSHDTNMSSNCAANNENAICGSLIRIGFEIVNIKNTKFQGTNHKTCGIHALTTRKKFAHQFVLSFLQTLHAKGHATQCRNLLFCIS